MKGLISKFLLWLAGWTVQGTYSEDLKECVIVVAPHTSNWDFVWGILARIVYGLKARYLIKHTLFKPGIGWFFRWTGGIPVDRSQNNNLIDLLKKHLAEEEYLQLVFTPEGTRSWVECWKRGFYWVAHESSLPVVMHSIDFKLKLITMNEPFYTTGNWDEDIKAFEEFYADKTGGNPENFNPSFNPIEKSEN